MTARDLFGVIVRTFGVIAVAWSFYTAAWGLFKQIGVHTPSALPISSDFAFAGVELAIGLILLRGGDWIVWFAYGRK